MLSRKNLNLPNNGKLDKMDLFFCKKSFVAIKNKATVNNKKTAKIGKTVFQIKNLENVIQNTYFQKTLISISTKEFIVEVVVNSSNLLVNS